MQTKFILLLTIYLLAGCVHGTGEVMNNEATNTHVVSSQYGLMGGGWSRASKEAAEKAVEYCDGLGKKYKLVKERQTGSPGWTPLQSTLTFDCVEALPPVTNIGG